MGSNRSEFIVIYGRRRVGKTFLVRELFDQRMTFRMTGKENTSTKEQFTKGYDAMLSRRLRIFRKATRTRKSLVTTFVTPNGLIDNVYARRIVREVTGDRLFG